MGRRSRRTRRECKNRKACERIKEEYNTQYQILRKRLVKYRVKVLPTFGS